MRIRSLAVPGLVVLALAACRTTDEDETEEPPFLAFEEEPEEPAGETLEDLEDLEDPEDPDEMDDEVAVAQEPPEPPPQDPQEVLEEAEERLERLRQRQRLLAGEFIEQGDRALDRADLEEALQAYAQALEVMPESEEARGRLRQVQAMMGERFPGAAEELADAAARDAVRVAQARLRVEQFVTEAENAMRLRRFDEAIEKFRRALTILRADPFLASERLDERIIEAKLETARQMAAEEERRVEREREAEARLLEEQREAELRRNLEDKLTTLYAEANAAFKRQDYSTAEALAKQILLWDPANPYAMELRDIAASARHQKTDVTNRRLLRENWIRTFEEIESAAVPQQDTIVFDDLKRWTEVIRREPLQFTRLDVVEAEDEELVRERLRRTRVRARFGEDGEPVPLSEVAAFLQNVAGVNFVISNRVRDELDEDETSVYLDLPERSVESVLNIIADTHEQLGWKIEDGVVKFVTRDEMIGGQVLAMYEVRDLVHPVRDFPGREINIQPSGGVEPPWEDLPEREALVLTEGSLEAVIQDNVSPESWDEDPRNSLRIANGTLIVYQTPRVQEQIRNLLADLREATGIMVDVQARFLTVEDNFLEDIGVDFRGLGAPGLGTNEFFDDFGDSQAQSTLGQEIGNDIKPGIFFDDGNDGDILGRIENLYDTDLGDEDVLVASGGLSFQWTYLSDLQLEMILRAVSKSERVELVTAPRLLVANTARSNLSVMNQVAYVQDYDVEIAQASSIADPIISVVEDGVILDVRPVVSADRRFITLELRPTVAQLVRPIPTFTTSLGTSGNSVTLELPELDVSRARTTLPMPDGATVLLGGFKVRDYRDLRSGVPILNKIPIVSFFFDRKGTFVSNRKLLILLKAKIVIPPEHEPTPAQLGLDRPRLTGAAPR